MRDTLEYEEMYFVSVKSLLATELYLNAYNYRSECKHTTELHDIILSSSVKY
jgi:hypothetical protein